MGEKPYTMDKNGEMEIDWLTQEDKNHINFFDQFHCWSGMWRSKKSIQWTYFWLSQMIAFSLVYFYSFYFLLSELELLAHLIHHMMVAADDIMYIYLLNIHRIRVETIHDYASKTYNYDSGIVREKHKKLMTEQLKLYPKMSKFIFLTTVATAMSLEVNYLLEATYLKSYVTMYPMYLPIDLNHPVTYTIVVFLQHLQVFISMILCGGLMSILFVVWSHLKVELDTLTFAITHVDELVEEKLRHFSYTNPADKEKAKAEFYNGFCYHFARHHAAIKRYFGAFQISCKVTMTFVLISGLICFACVGITSVTENIGIKLKFFVVMVIQTLIIYSWSWVGQDISDKNAALQNIIGGTHWWKMPKTCHSTLKLMLVGTSRPMLLYTLIGQPNNIDSFMDMTASSYKIFNMVYQVKFSS
uniref:Odorant receptor n=1 Tax=Apolygus lucorum TaxID=248454 RepID=A0A1Q1NIM1_APOLU|nr:olfactory receptor [Apolygus lucorum]